MIPLIHYYIIGIQVLYFSYVFITQLYILIAPSLPPSPLPPSHFILKVKAKNKVALHGGNRVLVFNTTFNNISVTS